MAFHTNSRYYGEPTVEVEMDGRTVSAVKLRSLPTLTSDAGHLRPQDRLDLLAHERFGDGTRFWHVADANTEREANRLLERLAEDEPRIIRIPRS